MTDADFIANLRVQAAYCRALASSSFDDEMSLSLLEIANEIEVKLARVEEIGSPQTPLIECRAGRPKL